MFFAFFGNIIHEIIWFGKLAGVFFVGFQGTADIVNGADDAVKGMDSHGSISTANLHAGTAPQPGYGVWRSQTESFSHTANLLCRDPCYLGRPFWRLVF